MTAKDERVCPICKPLHNTVVSLDGAWTADVDDAGNFINVREAAGGEGVMAPPVHPRCRCWLQPVISEAGAAEAIRRAIENG